MRLEGVIEPQVRPDDAVSVRLTVPVKPLRAVMVIVDVADVPMGAADGEVATIEKSATVKTTVAEWESVPLVPVTTSW